MFSHISHAWHRRLTSETKALPIVRQGASFGRALRTATACKPRRGAAAAVVLLCGAIGVLLSTRTCFAGLSAPNGHRVAPNLRGQALHAVPPIQFNDKAGSAVPLRDMAPDGTANMEEYLKTLGYTDADMSKDGLPLLTLLPDNITPEWILTSFLLPGLAFFVFNLLTTPLQDKLMGKGDYEVDYSGKSGFIYEALAEAGLVEKLDDKTKEKLVRPVEPEEPDFPAFGSLENLRAERSDDIMNKRREEFESLTGGGAATELAEAQKKAEEKTKEAPSKPATKETL
eukprot:TRINITY_DN20933_c0_g1_i1.p1 TRINITY_DN20933_c0_g1~~TRINITY_DN20933_c0_g1_i1.p1  ORF type:complete len:285 (+),score=84.39 TRINITY_DN20933_c0_g1_i1:68-922(+)